ncbi:hypothetical protein COU76_01790 [Candidatus Peregrinibacteria bacterium CG10_big_fil_rev_8_21_14_0_10_49_10]|nr:MAG: hypothetical protein COU76_01790 [Candidatus Peregrinibacteria bacterium CG10_big_fil_rev_8_21_14_0_10_49_10]
MSLQPIHHTFGPHVSGRYARKADRLLLTPWTWKHTVETERLRSAIQEQFGGSVHLFASGREALLALLRSLQFEQGAEIIVQGFTCVALPNAIHAAGYTPVYVDIDKETLNMDTQALQGRISNRTRAIICQHTFGIPADTARLRHICTEKHIILIEDCAHILPDKAGPDAIARQGDYLLLSLNRDKALSGMTGGAIVDCKRSRENALCTEEKTALPLRRGHIARLLLYAPLYRKTRFVYGLCGLGKMLLFLSRKVGLLLPVLTAQEKEGTMSPQLHTMPEPCAALARMEWPNLQAINSHRRARTAQYLAAAAERGWKMPRGVQADLPLQKFPLYVEDADAIRTRLKQKGMYLDDGWTGAVVCPRSAHQETANYTAGSCPHAEYVARHILTLPTHPTTTEKQAKKLIQSLSSLLG